MTALSPTATVADLVVERPGRARVLEELQIDYCCGGKRTLADACRRRGLELDVVLATIAARDEEPPHGAHDLRGLGIGDVCDHVEAVHHAPLRIELPRIAALLEKVVRAHGDDRPELDEAQATFTVLRAELVAHMADEEANAFPAFRRLADGGDASGAVSEAVAGLEHDHAATGRLLERLAELTGGYDTTSVGCNTHRAVVHALGELERDLHLHIHEENNVLFPRVLRQAGYGDRLAGSPAS